MGIYNEFWVFNPCRVIPVAHLSIYNRNVGGFFSDNIHNFEPNEEYVIDGSLISRLLQSYEDGTLKRSPLANPRDPLLFSDEEFQLGQIKKYAEDGYKIVYVQI